MLNKLILSIKTVANNHKQVASVLIGDAPEQAGQQYPLVRIWPNGSNLSTLTGNRHREYKIVVAVSDRHQDSPESALEAISDCDAIIEDLISSLITVYKDEAGINWSIRDSIENFYDQTPDIVAGSMATFIANVPFKRDYCQVPIKTNQAVSFLLLQDGGFLLQQTGDKIIL